MAELREFVSRDVLIRRRTERHMPELEAAFAIFGYPTFALQRPMYRAVLSAMLRSRIQVSMWQAINGAWFVVNEMQREALQ